MILLTRVLQIQDNVQIQDTNSYTLMIAANVTYTLVVQLQPLIGDADL